MKGDMALFGFGLLRTSHWNFGFPVSEAKGPKSQRPQAQKPEIPTAKGPFIIY